MDEDTMRRKVLQYKDTVYKIAYTYCKNTADSEDIFQEVFLRYFKNAPAFLVDEHEKAWLIRLTINSCKKLLGSYWFRKTVQLDENISFTFSRHRLI